MNVPTQKSRPTDEPDYFSPEEAGLAIVKIDAKGKAILMKLARSYWEDRVSGPNSAYGPDDLLQEAIVRTLQGKRRWRRSVTILKHLVRTMESISWHTKTTKDAQLHSWVENSVEEIDPAECKTSVLEILVAQEELAMIENYFKDDLEALEVLRYRSLDLSPSEICAHLGIDKARYDTVSKRIWRKIIKISKNRKTGEWQ